MDVYDVGTRASRCSRGGGDRLTRHLHLSGHFLGKPVEECLYPVVEAVSGTVLHAKEADYPDRAVSVEDYPLVDGNNRQVDVEVLLGYQGEYSVEHPRQIRHPDLIRAVGVAVGYPVHIPAEARVPLIDEDAVLGGD